MKYNDLKKEYDTVKVKALKKKHELAELRKKCAELDKDRNSLHTSYTERYEQAKKQGAAEYKKKMLAPVENSLLEAEKKLDQLKQSYSTEMEAVTYESVAAECSSEQEILDEVNEAMQKLQELLERAVGKKFYRALSGQMQAASGNIGKDELPGLVEYFNRKSAEVEEMLKGSKFDSMVIRAESFIDADDGNGTLGQNRKALAAVSVLFLFLSFAAAKFVFPFYVVFLAVFAVYNVMRGDKFFDMMLTNKLVADNVTQIAEVLKGEIDAEVERRKAETSGFYDSEIKAVEKEIEKLNDKILSIAVTADRTFKFNDTEVKKSLEQELAKSSDQSRELSVKEKGLLGELMDLESREAALKEKLEGLVGDIQNKYLDFSNVGSETILDPVFLFDIDTDKNKPIFFQHPQASCLFIYENVEESINFVRLLVSQLRCKLSPFCQAVSVLDELHLGQDFLYFRSSGIPDDSPEAGLFTIFTEADAFHAKIDDLTLELMQRTESMRREFKNIEEYNKAMVSLDSVTASYEFVFMISPELSLLEDPKLRKLLINGGAYGIFVHVFLDTDAFKEGRDGSKKLLDSVEKVFLLMNGNFNVRAKANIIENYFPDNKH